MYSPSELEFQSIFLVLGESVSRFVSNATIASAVTIRFACWSFSAFDRHSSRRFAPGLPVIVSLELGTFTCFEKAVLERLNCVVLG